MTPMVGEFSLTAASCASVSAPKASPETTPKPAAAASEAMAVVIRAP